MSASQSNVTALYAELNKAIHISDYRQALKSVNKILHNTKGAKDENEAIQCKAVCLIELNSFAEALKFIESTDLHNDELIFEKAYCQYRLLQSKEALNTLNSVKEPDLRLLELKAQVLYKLGMYKEALVIYKRLIKECSDDFEDERMTNLTAVHAALSAFDGVQTELGFEAETHEQLYNKSCWLVGQRRFDEAEKTLLKAESVCKAQLADDPDITEEEKDAEVSLIRVQLAYTLQCQGKIEEATQIYSQAIRSRPSDVALVAVASNNIICINKDQNVFDSRKKVKATVASGLDNKLVPFQLEKIGCNRALLMMYGSQWEACRKLLKSLHREYGSEVPCMIQTAMLCREKNLKAASQYLEDYIERNSDPDLPSKFDLTNVKLTLIQLLLSQGELNKACALLEGLEEFCYTPAIVSCLVSLYTTQTEPVDSVTRLMENALAWHRKKESSADILKSLLWEYSQFLLKNQLPQAAAKTLESLLKLDENNVKALAQLIFAYSQFNPSKAHQVSEDLPSLEELSVHVDVDELEKNAARLAPRYVKKQKEKEKKESPVVEQVKKNVVSEGSAAVTEPIKKKKKKKKKNPVPKDFQADFVPDPERWIPLRERSYYKGRRKDKKRGGVGKGTQGTYAGAGEFYDTKSASSYSKPTTSPTTTPVNSPKPSSSRNAPKGKKPVQKRRRKGKN